MKSLTQKYCLISLLEPTDAGSTFSCKDWILHITFAEVHFAYWDDEMKREFESLIQSIYSFDAKTLEQGKLGEGDADVVFVDKSVSVLQLHDSIIDFLDSHKAVFNNPEWNRDGYIPHSSIQKHAQVTENETIQIDNVALVDMFPESDGYMRKIIKVFNLMKQT